MGGATANDIQHHYDVGNSFYALWLDKHFVYSSARPERDTDPLEDAQLNKLDYHIDALGLNNSNARVLDVGCGWGALLKRGLDRGYFQNPHGLTLSQQQKNACEANLGTDASVSLDFGRSTTRLHTTASSASALSSTSCAPMTIDGQRPPGTDVSSTSALSTSSPAAVFRCRRSAMA